MECFVEFFEVRSLMSLIRVCEWCFVLYKTMFFVCRCIDG